MSRTARMRNLSIREPEDNAFRPRSSSSTVSAPPFKGPRGRPLKKPRTALAYKITEQVSQGKVCQEKVGQEQVGQEQVGHGQISYKISNLQIISTSTLIIATPSAAPADHTATHNAVHKLENKRKRTLSEEVYPTDLQTACEGCRRTIYPHGRNQGQDVKIICYKCNKEWHALCMAREGIKRCEVPGQWECCNCSRKGKTLPSQPAYTDDTQADVMNFSKITVIQAQNDYKEARDRLSDVLNERETCRERLNKLKSKIRQFGLELDEHRRHFNSNSVNPSDRELKHSMIQRLVLRISADTDWTDKVSAKNDLIKAEEARLTERVKSLQGNVKMKKATLKGVKQQRLMYSTYLETSSREFEKLRSIITMDFEENSPNDSNTSSESIIEDFVANSATDTRSVEITHSANADISPNGIAKGIERQAEEAN
ncbi:hypothetical protein V496_06544 [Pseudogymnoascus sp. VKM F-4515 (FW-2607)]|nr:hypothetical protein V496_06544 [Pseudogymnoascus sp. VKM F-4515 (FW-2607)]